MVKRIFQSLRLDKIAAVDRPCQEPALMTIMKRGNTPWRDHRTDAEERDRRAASARANLEHPYDPPPEDLETKETSEMEPKTQLEAYAAMEKIAKGARRTTETEAAACARCLASDPKMQALYGKSRHLPYAEPLSDAAFVAKIQQESAYQALLEKAGEARQADPKLTKEQAFTKVYTDRSKADLVMMHKRTV
jgi:hypothetical protein